MWFGVPIQRRKQIPIKKGRKVYAIAEPVREEIATQVFSQKIDAFYLLCFSAFFNCVARYNFEVGQQISLKESLQKFLQFKVDENTFN